MNCDIAREALSARIDGEREPIPSSHVDEHLAGCEPCRTWQAAAVEQTQLLRRLAGRSQVAVVRAPVNSEPDRLDALVASWPRWSLGAVGVTQVALAITQSLGAGLGVPQSAAGHVLNESTAWSAALGVVMIVAALRPALAGGLAWVLAAFAGLLVIYEFDDAFAGQVGIERGLTHLPIVAGALLAFLVWRRDRATSAPEPDRTALADPDDFLLPDNASRRRGNLRSTDGSAA